MDEFPPWFKLGMGNDKARLIACKLRQKIVEHMDDLVKKGYISVYCGEKEFPNPVVKLITRELREREFAVKLVGEGSFRKLIIATGKGKPIGALGLCKKCFKNRSIDEYFDEKNCIYCKVITQE